MRTLTLTDETATGKILHQINLQFEKEYISVQELIEGRVRLEVAQYQEKTESYRRVLVQPQSMETRLNNKQAPKIDVEKQLYVALEAFQRNGFFILIDDEQVETLDQKFLVDEATQVSFIKLTPLVGG